jgi:Protein of unknown function (DUF2750)
MSSWEMNDRERSSVLELPAAGRYDYTVKRVADWGTIWSLRDRSGWALAADDNGRELVPVWPHPDFAVACTHRQWIGMQPANVDLNEWIEDWLPGMSDDGRGVAVFPTPQNRGVVVEPERMGEDLAAELERFEP